MSLYESLLNEDKEQLVGEILKLKAELQEHGIKHRELKKAFSHLINLNQNGFFYSGVVDKYKE